MASLLDLSGYESEDNDVKDEIIVTNNFIDVSYKEDEQNDNKLIDLHYVANNENQSITTKILNIEPNIVSKEETIIDIDNATDKNINKKFKYIHEIPSIPKSNLPNPNTIENVKYYLNVIKLHNFNLINSIRANKEFDNPYILSEIAEFFNIQQSGSNYPTQLFNPEELNSKNFDEFFKKRSIATSKPVSVNYITTSNISNNNNNNSNVLSNKIASIVNNIVLSTSTISTVIDNTSNAENKRKSRWG